METYVEKVLIRDARGIAHELSFYDCAHEGKSFDFYFRGMSGTISREWDDRWTVAFPAQLACNGGKPLTLTLAEGKTLFEVQRILIQRAFNYVKQEMKKGENV